MTNEELDAARYEEATNQVCALCITEPIAFLTKRFSIYRNLVTCGWTPAPAIDPLVLEAREICASYYDEDTDRDADEFRRGDLDWYSTMEITLEALKRGMELAREQGKAEPVAPVPVDREREVLDKVCLKWMIGDETKAVPIIRTYGDERYAEGERAGKEVGIAWVCNRFGSAYSFLMRRDLFGGAGDE